MHVILFPAVRMGLSCSWKQLFAVRSTTEVNTSRSQGRIQDFVTRNRTSTPTERRQETERRHEMERRHETECRHHKYLTSTRKIDVDFDTIFDNRHAI